MRKLTITKVLAIALVFFVAGVALGGAAQSFVGPTATNILARLGFPVDPNVAKLLSIRNIVLSRHVNKDVDPDQMMEQAIRGLLSRVDGGFTRYESQEEAMRRVETDTGAYSGIGVTVRMVEDQVNIESVFRGSPAQGAGLLPRDIIIRVEDENIRGMLLTDVTDIIKGPVGTPVKLTIYRPSQNSAFDVVITRGKIIIPVVDYEILSPDLAHLILTQFVPNATEQMRVAVQELENAGVKHILLDLRFNPGGYTNVTEAIADYFLDPGLVIYTGVDREGNTTPYSTRTAKIFTGTVTLLVNQGSASSAEILTGALRDHMKSVVLGVTTYGKGTVQVGYPLGDGSRVWVTTLTYRTPAGTDINKKGIVPDVVIEVPEGTPPGQDVQLVRAIEYVRQNFPLR